MAAEESSEKTDVERIINKKGDHLACPDSPDWSNPKLLRNQTYGTVVAFIADGVFRHHQEGLVVSFEAKQDWQVESNGNRQDRIRRNLDASEEMREASDLIAERWISKRTFEVVDVSDSASQSVRILASDRENLADKQSPLAPERRDWTNLYGCGQIEDRLLAPVGSASGQTARSALKSILQKHHARVKSGQDRLLDLRDF